MARAEMLVSLEMLRELLGLPEEATILAVRQADHGGRWDAAGLLIEHEDFAPGGVKDGRVEPIFEKDADGHAVFKAWNRQEETAR